MKNIAGIFYNQRQANDAVSALMQRGFTQQDISILMSDEAKKRHFHGDNNMDEAAKGGAVGAAAGGVLGGLLAALTAVGSLTIPGVGLLAAGPLVAALSGLGAGAALGGIGGALVSVGFAEAEAKRYEDQIRKGNVVLIVRTDKEEEILAAHEILRRHEAMTEAV